MILGLVWTLILRFTITTGSDMWSEKEFQETSTEVVSTHLRGIVRYAKGVPSKTSLTRLNPVSRLLLYSTTSAQT